MLFRSSEEDEALAAADVSVGVVALTEQCSIVVDRSPIWQSCASQRRQKTGYTTE